MRNKILFLVLGALLGAGAFGIVWYTSLRTDPQHYLDLIAQAEKRCKVTETAGDPAPAIDSNSSQVQAFVFKPSALTVVSFFSRAPLEDILGTNKEVSGELVIDLRNPNVKAEGRLTLAMSGFMTGIELRDDHLRDTKFLDVATYPNATFEITGVETDQQIVLGKTSTGTISGNFTFRGKTLPMTMPVTVTYVLATPELEKIYIDSNLLVIDGSFDLDLTQYGMPGLERIGGKKVSETVQITLKLAATEK
ncbi:MAG: hypothetical protein CMH54_03200 [Myxococcales bacterium]|nr:hypothetical protein [Myxococcales bacterium]